MSNWDIVVPVSADMLNEETNPSFEGSTTGWTTGGTNTIAQSSTRAFRGVYSALITYGNSLILASDTITLASTSTTYALIARVWVSTNWDNGNISMNVGSMSGAVATVVKQYTHGTSTTGTWIKLYTSVAVSSDVTGTVTVLASTNPTVGRTLYLDSIAIIEIDGEPTYFDGDEDNCYWNSTRHLSTSTFDRRYRNKGTVVDLSSYSFYPDDPAGIGSPVTSNIRRNLPLQPGSLHQRQNLGERLIALNGIITGTSQNNLHSLRKALYGVLKETATPFPSEVLLRWKGSHYDNQAEIRVRFDGGLEFQGRQGFAENTQLRFLANDPYWYGLDDGSTVMSAPTTTLSNANGVLHRGLDGTWDNMDEGVTDSGSAPSLYKVLIASDNTVYIGDAFDQAGSGPTSVSNIARYDPATDSWDDVASGCDDTVYDMVEGPTGLIYVVGAFSSAGGDTDCNHVGVYDPSGDSWADLDEGTNGTVYCCGFDFIGNFWVGGSFTTIGSGATSAPRIGYYHPVSGWTAKGTIDNGSVLAMDIKGVVVVIAGTFTQADSGGANSLQRVGWSTHHSYDTWLEIGKGMGDDTVQSIKITSSNQVYIGGDFTQDAGGEALAGIAYANGLSDNAAWKPLKDGITDSSSPYVATQGIAEMQNGWLFITGGFDEVDHKSVDSSAIWTGSDWLVYDIIPPTSKVGVSWEEGPLGAYLVFDGVGTATVPSVQSITNAGTAPAFPIIEIIGPSSGIAQLHHIINFTTGKGIYFTSDLQLQAGDKYVLDLRRGKKLFYSQHAGTVGVIGTIGGAVQTNWIYGLDLIGSILPGSNLADFSLVPGANDIFLFTDGSTVDVNINWRNAYETADGVAT